MLSGFSRHCLTLMHTKSQLLFVSHALVIVHVLMCHFILRKFHWCCYGSSCSEHHCKHCGFVLECKCRILCVDQKMS